MKLPVYTAGNGTPILMIHGIISDGSFFHDAAELLKEQYTVITYDRRGYGAGMADDIRDFSVRSQAEDAAEILKTYAKEPAWIFGNSAGGLVAIELCLHYPELVKGMILLEPSLAFDEESKELLGAWNRELNGYLEEKKIKKALRAFIRIVGESKKSGEQNTGRSATMEEMARTYKNLNNFMYGELNEVQRYFPDPARVKEIEVPVAVLISSEGADTLFARTSRNGAGLLGWTICKIPGNHNAVKDMPASSAQIIKKVLCDMENGTAGQDSGGIK